MPSDRPELERKKVSGSGSISPARECVKRDGEAFTGESNLGRFECKLPQKCLACYLSLSRGSLLAEGVLA